MKAAFITAGILCAMQASGQKLKQWEPSLLDSIKVSLPKDGLRPVLTKKKEWKKIGESRLGAIYELPQDRMPCIVPNMEMYRQMPNSGQELLNRPIDPQIYGSKEPRLQ